MQKTHVVMLLDESGSMAGYRSEVVSTFNEYVQGLKEGKRVWLSLFKFSNLGFMRAMTEAAVLPNLRCVFENRKVKDTYPLTSSQYTPNGGTPLYDAIGELIDRTKERLSKDAKVLFVIHTDGQENMSKRFTASAIKKKIAKMEKKRGWTFVYLGEGKEAWNKGYDFGVSNVANFSSNLRGTSMGKLAEATVTYSSAKVGGQYGATRSFYADAKLDPDDIDLNPSAADSADAVKASTATDEAGNAS